MTVAEEYLKKLQEREPHLFPEPLRKSTLTDKDLLKIEKVLGYQLPDQYKEFLQSYQLPETITVYPGFCGNNIGARFRTYKSATQEYISEQGQLHMPVDMKWHNNGGTNAAQWLDSVKCCMSDSALYEAGYIDLGNLCEDYFLLYDLVDGEVFMVHYEEYYDMGYEYGNEVMTGGFPEKLREGISCCSCVLYKCFNDFLRHVCTGEYYYEEEMAFVTYIYDEEKKEFCLEEI